MTTDERRGSLRKAILEAVKDSLVRESVLQSQVADVVEPPATLTELRDELSALEGQRLVSSLRPGLGGPLKWIATERGRAALHD